MTYEPNGEAKFQMQPDTPAPDEDAANDIPAEDVTELDGEVASENDDATDAAPVTPPDGGSIGADGKVYYGGAK